MICASGDAESEAKLINETALHSNINGGLHASHVNCVSSQTDNAARATSRECKKLKGEELDEVKRLIAAHAAIPTNMQHAVDSWMKMTRKQQEDAYEMFGIGCTGHSVNLTTEDSHKHSESKELSSNMVRDRAARILQRFCLARAARRDEGGKRSTAAFFCSRSRKTVIVSKGYAGCAPMFKVPVFNNDGDKISDMCLLPAGKHLDGGDLPSVTEIVRQVSMLLSSEGEHHAYYLNEHRAFNLFATKMGLVAMRLLSCKGSRQHYTVQQPTRVLRNTSAYLQYLHETRVDSDVNQLVDGVWNGLRDRFVLGALRARSFVDAAFATPLIFFTHSDSVKTLSLFNFGSPM